MESTCLTNEELIDQVRTWAARVARGEAELLELIGELDAREAWAAHGVTSCAHWLSWQLGWSDTTAREHVRVARALRELPLIRAALAEGRLSYSRVRAVTRMATPEDEPRWLELARHSTGAQLDKIARGAARAKAAETSDGPRPAKRAAQVDWDDDGDLVLTLRIPAHEAVPVLAVLDQQRTVVQAERDEALRELLAAALPQAAPAEAPPVTAPTHAQGPLAAEDAKGYDPLQPYPGGEPDYPIGPDRIGLRLSDAEQAALRDWEGNRARWREIRNAWNTRREQLLIEASAQRVPTGRASLADALVRALTRPAQGPRTTVRLLQDPLTGWARTHDDELLPPAVLDRLVRAFPTSTSRRPVDLRAHDQGRTSRLASPALRRLLGQVDGERCRFPGCRHTRFLNAHHVLFWRHGGPTDLSNLVLLCGKHHRILHLLGYQLELDADRTVRVTAPDGTLLEPLPTLRAASAEALPPAIPTTLQNGYGGDRLDLGYAVNVMLAHAA